MSRDESKSARRIARRSVLKGAAAAAGAATMARLGITAARADEAKFSLVNPKYQPLYDGTPSYYFNDPQWVKDTIPRLTWPKPGEPVPEIGVIIPTNEPDWIDSF